MKGILFLQLFEATSSTYTYLIADRETKEAAIIDPVLETVERDLKFVRKLDLRLKYILETHIHADHISGAATIRGKTDAKTAISSLAKVDCADIQLTDEQKLPLGNKKITAMATPGHTKACMSFYFEGMVFTGDSLLIRGTGRTDFQEGSSEKLYESITQKLFRLPDETRVLPGHDYRGLIDSTIALEKKLNPRIGGNRSKEEFKKIMDNLCLSFPKKMDVAVPINLACGNLEAIRRMKPEMKSTIPVVSYDDVLANLGKIKIIDVRHPGEFHGRLGHIRTAKRFTLGLELTKFLRSGDPMEEIVFVCRSGKRSEQAVLESIRFGYKFTVSLAGGMVFWNSKSLPTEKE
ncbi:MBL fold metallo-hydrolase [Leptospira gomenensis]|uniref:MBL fold metallo-hydrolase n=1 Tax=Leptospira gomenensis TaxID=2484974 RepID=A0A5F1YGH0_9LEPT|nr:MBL fold metallo-hydrolase [Leptospira gomenensis]TGK32394.1 MBL fold metallo-hydrolase [Leptospira gomenensis]TGK43962.1 MBL fold metallo-hydrolase [Leptospira gomenensis]TGK48961.1 MBL fold metallo-hydrolase [Leptospira gomenensis]TGK54672.1 MBL fold metallo-hydrolase [Leptospira gomenensis]